MRIQENGIVSDTKTIIKNRRSGKQILELLRGGTWKDYNKSPLHNRNYIKANCDINEPPDVRFPLYI